MDVDQSALLRGIGFHEQSTTRENTVNSQYNSIVLPSDPFLTYIAMNCDSRRHDTIVQGSQEER